MNAASCMIDQNVVMRLNAAEELPAARAASAASHGAGRAGILPANTRSPAPLSLGPERSADSASCPKCGGLEFDARTNSGRILGLQCCRCGHLITGSFGSLTRAEELRVCASLKGC